LSDRAGAAASNASGGLVQKLSRVDSLSCAAWEVVYWVLRLFWFAMLIYAVASWIPSLQGRWTSYVARIVEPVLLPVRRIIPPVGGLDLSFLVVILLLGFVMNSIPGFAYGSSYCWIR
jgi:YggT family protein